MGFWMAFGAFLSGTAAYSNLTKAHPTPGDLRGGVFLAVVCGVLIVGVIARYVTHGDPEDF
jgi:hypothetical protein